MTNNYTSTSVWMAQHSDIDNDEMEVLQRFTGWRTGTDMVHSEVVDYKTEMERGEFENALNRDEPSQEDLEEYLDSLPDDPR